MSSAFLWGHSHRPGRVWLFWRPGHAPSHTSPSRSSPCAVSPCKKGGHFFSSFFSSVLCLGTWGLAQEQASQVTAVHTSPCIFWWAVWSELRLRLETLKWEVTPGAFKILQGLGLSSTRKNKEWVTRQQNPTTYCQDCAGQGAHVAAPTVVWAACSTQSSHSSWVSGGACFAVSNS